MRKLLVAAYLLITIPLIFVAHHLAVALVAYSELAGVGMIGLLLAIAWRFGDYLDSRPR